MLMLRAVGPGASVVVCSTCRLSAEQRADAAGRRGGALLVEALHRVRDGDPAYAAVAVQDMPCLFACDRHCAVHVRGTGKVGYVLGDFTPDEEAARAILDYAARHAESEEGVVRYADWPQGVKGHFIVRTPPDGFVCS
ncbi:metal-binding protein [Sphingobium indicum IP26]|nr:metal-binding protein [Sphingobium indicum IP26]EPR15294.1 metal-binding protein [Sphingobium indicum IP26]